MSARAILEALACGAAGCPCAAAARRGGGLSHCPAHDDHNPSLSLSENEGRVLVRCFAGCTQQEVIGALRARGLWPDRGEGGGTSPGGPFGSVQANLECRASGVQRRATGARVGLTLTQLAEAKRLPADFLRGLGLRDVFRNGTPAVAIPYFDPDGNEAAVRYRLALEGGQRFAWRRGTTVLPYGLERLGEARKAGWVLLVEGESDAWTAWYAGVPALGLPGKSTWRSAWAEHLAGVDVYAWVEPGADDLALRIGHDLPEARCIFAPHECKDLSEAHIAGRDVRRLVEELKDRAVPISQLLRAAEDSELAALEATAQPILEADDPVDLIRTEIAAHGYGGDPTPALITYLAATTRLLAMRPGAMLAHLLLVGPPSAGKSYTVSTVLRLLPPEAYHTIDAGSPRVLIYDDADLRHRVVIFAEADSLPSGEDNPAASAVRSLLQEHRLAYKVVVRNPETGEFGVRTVSKDGPTVLITTSTRPLGGQLGTRVFTLAIPEDPARVRTILHAQAALEHQPPPGPSEELVAFQRYLQRLAPWDVVVPFARALAEEIGRRAAASRIQRDFARLLALIKAAAVLRHRRRQRDEQGRVVAELADYETVRQLVEPAFEHSVTGASPQLRAVVEAVAALRREGRERVSYNAVAERLGLHHEQVRRLVRQAVRAEWLTNRAEGRGRPADLDVGEPLPPHEALPTAEELAELHAVARSCTPPAQPPEFTCTPAQHIPEALPPSPLQTVARMGELQLQPVAPEERTTAPPITGTEPDDVDDLDRNAGAYQLLARLPTCAQPGCRLPRSVAFPGPYCWEHATEAVAQ